MDVDREFYYHEIIGLEVYEDDVLLGRMKILQPGANDVGSLSDDYAG